MSEGLSEVSVASDSPHEEGVSQCLGIQALWLLWRDPSMVTAFPKGCLTGFTGIARRKNAGWDFDSQKTPEKGERKKAIILETLDPGILVINPGREYKETCLCSPHSAEQTLPKNSVESFLWG